MRFPMPEGCTVKYRHQREYDTVVQPKGGATVATVFDPLGNPLADGIARCSRRDNYRKVIGRQIALGRALKALAKSGDLAARP